MLNDTIVAISTPSGRAGIGIVRISGQFAIEVVQNVTDKNLTDRKPTLCNIKDKTIYINKRSVIFDNFPQNFLGKTFI